VATADDRPFYAQLMLVDAHSPFPKAAPIAGVPQNVADYRAALGRLDTAIQRLVEGLAAHGLDDDTLIVVLNDHGEGLRYPEHHGKSHGRYLFPSTVGGVGVWVGPGIPAGHTVTGIASQVDVAPTLWSLAGLPPRTDWGGVDLSAAVLGTTGRTARTRAYTDTWFRRTSRAAFYETDRMCQLAGRDLELTDVNGITFHPGCFDRAADPQYARPMVDAGALRALNDWRLDAFTRGQALALERSEASEGLGRQLEALGYVDEEP
jgi:arylsulfatase A-like enzyme